MANVVENAEIVEVKRIAGSLLVTFSDGRMTALYSDEIYAQSVAVPERSIFAGSSDNNSPLSSGDRRTTSAIVLDGQIGPSPRLRTKPRTLPSTPSSIHLTKAPRAS